MKQNSKLSISTSPKIVLDLLSQHQKFHEFLDRLAAKTDDVNVIQLLINIRGVNLECISRFTGLLSKQKISTVATPTVSNRLSTLKEDDMTLWNIHGQLARFVPVYRSALQNRNLTQIARRIISINNDQLITLKEHLLHPVNEVTAA